MTTTTTSAPAQPGTLEYLDPAQIVLEDNVRPSAPVTDEFVDSIRQHGVLQPVRGHRDEHGTVHVRAGQRRVLAARDAGLASMPVFVVESTDQATQRIVEQIVENDQREDLTDAARTAAWRQLALEGLTPAAIAKRTGTKTARVKTGLKVADNELATTAISAHQLTLDQAATLVEFEDDTDTVAELIEVATTSPEQFTHAAQRARDDRTRTKLRQAAEQGLIAKGFTILERDPGYYENTPVRITDLVDTDGTPVTVEQITGLAGASAFVRVYYGDEVSVSYFLDDPKAHGFRKDNGRPAGGMSEDEKAERREVIANNKAWDAAQTVRRSWLAEFLGRRTLPKDAFQVIAAALAEHRTVVAKGLSDGNTLAHDLLGLDQEGQYGWHTDRLAGHVTAHPTKAVHVALAVVLGGVEASTGRHSWRNPDHRVGDYLNTLARWGYTLSDVEQLITRTVPDDDDIDPGRDTPDHDADDETVTPSTD